VNLQDFLVYLAIYSGGDVPAADFNADGRVDMSDFLAYLAAFSDG
jgi:hypothetical protein